MNWIRSDWWIPASYENTPRDERKVLCCTVTKKGEKNIVVGYYSPELERWVCGMNSNVIAWMPLPEPPRFDRVIDVFEKPDERKTENYIRIKLEKRTPEEKRAWHEGYNYGLADGKRNENTTLIFKTKCRMGVGQYRITIRDLERQADRGLILLHPEIEFVQAVGNNPEVRLEYDDEPEE